MKRVICSIDTMRKNVWKEIEKKQKQYDNHTDAWKNSKRGAYCKNKLEQAELVATRLERLSDAVNDYILP